MLRGVQDQAMPGRTTPWPVAQHPDATERGCGRAQCLAPAQVSAAWVPTVTDGEAAAAGGAIRSSMTNVR